MRASRKPRGRYDRGVRGLRCCFVTAVLAQALTLLQAHGEIRCAGGVHGARRQSRFWLWRRGCGDGLGECRFNRFVVDRLLDCGRVCGNRFNDIRLADDRFGDVGVGFRYGEGHGNCCGGFDADQPLCDLLGFIGMHADLLQARLHFVPAATRDH